jgi:hypothetical protein
MAQIGIDANSNRNDAKASVTESTHGICGI